MYIITNCIGFIAKHNRIDPASSCKKKRVFLCSISIMKTQHNSTQYSNLWHFYGRLHLFEKLKTVGGYKTPVVFISPRGSMWRIRKLVGTARTVSTFLHLAKVKGNKIKIPMIVGSPKSRAGHATIFLHRNNDNTTTH